MRKCKHYIVLLSLIFSITAAVGVLAAPLKLGQIFNPVTIKAPLLTATGRYFAPIVKKTPLLTATGRKAFTPIVKQTPLLTATGRKAFTPVVKQTPLLTATGQEKKESRVLK